MRNFCLRHQTTTSKKTTRVTNTLTSLVRLGGYYVLFLVGPCRQKWKAVLSEELWKDLGSFSFST